MESQIQNKFPSRILTTWFDSIEVRHSREKKISEIIGKISDTNDLAEIADCELVIEAVTENKDIKVNILRQLDKVASGLRILATNTSTLSITEVASYTKQPNQFIDMYFFNPPLIMKMVETIMGW